MAKRSGASTFNKVLNSIPSKAEFDLTMVADTSVYNYVDIDTGIDDNQAWLIYGMEYWFENIAPATPFLEPIVNANAWQVQVIRGDDNAAMLGINEKEVIMCHKMTIGMSATADANIVRSPYQISKRSITMQETLRLGFQTVSDLAVLTTSIRMSGCIYYDTMPAPRGVATKIGQLSDL